MIKKIVMKNLICSNCAGKIEKALSNLSYIESASFNFPNQIMLIDVTEDYNEASAVIDIKKIVDSIEDGVETYAYDSRRKVESKISIDKYTSFFIGLISIIKSFLH